ncbi:MAG: DEAD/DEAH box helicase [Desulforhopalus sp.]
MSKPAMEPDIDEYITALKGSKKFGPQLVCHQHFKASDGEYAEDFPAIDPAVKSCLKRAGIEKLFSHQYQAIRTVLEGNDVLVATPTASGKSMIYNLPVLDDLCSLSPGYSLYLFPLKALAQDQRNVLEALFANLPEKYQEKHPHLSALYDGDTSAYKRRKIRDNPPRVLLTNPEMVHLALLPHHSTWREFFAGLRYVIIDEVHSYRGVLGSHMSWVLRRLQRIAVSYGAKPTYIMLSATIGNPQELGRLLTGRPVQVVGYSGAPKAEKHMLFLNPWDSAPYVASQLLEAAVKRGLRTIVYTQSRKMTELINIWTAPRLGNLAGKMSAYRAGFLPEERREIESRLFSGDLLGVISTSALELGIDIGDLDLCILVGYPGSVMATWQRGGRVGRGQRTSAIILIGQEDALDQHFMRHPQDFFTRKAEAAVLNPENITIMDQHLLCCAAELPLTKDEEFLRNNNIIKRVEYLSRSAKLLETASGGEWISSRKYPQRHVSLRGGGSQMSIIDRENGEVIGEIDGGRAQKECHPGAVYLHRSTTWIAEKLDLLGNEIVVRRENPRYFTRPLSEKRTEILECLESKQSYGATVSFGRVRVTEKITGFQKRHSVTRKLIATRALELPEQVVETESVWVDIPATIVARLEREKFHFMGAIHAMEHAMIALFPLLVLCDRNDIGGISCPLHHQTETATVFVYDGYPGGVGLAEGAFRQMDTLLAQTRSSVASCGCETGCPSCVHSPKCGSGNRPIDKAACLALMSEILESAAETSDGQRPVFSQAQTAPTNTSGDQERKQGRTRRGLAALPTRFGVFDLETIRSAAEVGGWSNPHKMGVSVAVVYDSESDGYVTYLEHEIDRLVDHLQRLELVVGFNNKRFDNRVLSAYTDVDLSRLPNLDLLEEVHAYLGYRLSLDRLAENTLGVKKTADGLQALRWYKEGRIDLIQHYCRKDVEITRNLFLHALERGFLLFTNKARSVVRLPLALETAIDKILRPV